MSGVHAYRPAGPPPVACCLGPDLMLTCIVHPEGGTELGKCGPQVLSRCSTREPAGDEGTVSTEKNLGR